MSALKRASIKDRGMDLGFWIMRSWERVMGLDLGKVISNI